MRKMVNIGSAQLQALELLSGDTGKAMPDLFEEAIADLLKKHRRPVTVHEMFAESAAQPGARHSQMAEGERRRPSRGSENGRRRRRR